MFRFIENLLKRRDKKVAEDILLTLELSHILFPTSATFSFDDMETRLSHMRLLIKDLPEVLLTIKHIMATKGTDLIAIVNGIHNTPLAHIPYFEGHIEGGIEVFDTPRLENNVWKVGMAKRIEVVNGKVQKQTILEMENFTGGAYGQNQLGNLERITPEELEAVNQAAEYRKQHGIGHSTIGSPTSARPWAAGGDKDVDQGSSEGPSGEGELPGSTTPQP